MDSVKGFLFGLGISVLLLVFFMFLTIGMSYGKRHGGSTRCGFLSEHFFQECKAPSPQDIFGR